MNQHDQQALEKMKTQDELLIRVSAKNEVLGSVRKIEAHQFPGIQHRAITVFLINSQGDILLTQRSTKKPLWPLYWDAACSSHQWFPDESAVHTAERRVPFELGIPTGSVRDLKEIGSYAYRAVYSSEWVEHEWNYGVLGTYDGSLNLNREEVIANMWVTREKIESILSSKEVQIVPWFKEVWDIAKNFLE